MAIKKELEALQRLRGLAKVFAFGVPGGRAKIQKRIGDYLDGDNHALDKTPNIRNVIDAGLREFTEG